VILLKRSFERLLELISGMPMPVIEVNEDNREVVVKNANGAIGYVLENYTDEQVETIKRAVDGNRIRNERELRALEILEEFLSYEIDIRDYDSFFKLYDFVEEEYCEQDKTVTGTMIMCVDNYKVEMDMKVNLLDEEVYVYQAEDYQKCGIYNRYFLVEFIANIINSVKFGNKCNVKN